MPRPAPDMPIPCIWDSLGFSWLELAVLEGLASCYCKYYVNSWWILALAFKLYIPPAFTAAGPDVRGATAELLICVCICKELGKLFFIFGDWCEAPFTAPGGPPLNLLLDYYASISALCAFCCNWFAGPPKGFGPLIYMFWPIPLTPRMGLTLPG